MRAKVASCCRGASDVALLLLLPSDDEEEEDEEVDGGGDDDDDDDPVPRNHSCNAKPPVAKNSEDIMFVQRPKCLIPDSASNVCSPSFLKRAPLLD